MLQLLTAALCYPTLQGIDISVFGYVVNTTYTATFLPAVFGVVVSAPIYKFFNKVIPASFKNFTTPLLTLIIAFPLTFLLVGPFANLVGSGLNIALTSLFSISPIIAGTLFGSLFQVLVLFGVHGVIMMVPFMELMQGNSSQLLAFVSSATFAQIGVVLAIYLRTNDKKLKSIALPAFISGLFGVTEPAIYGITLPRIKMFIISCIGAGAGALIVALTNISAYSFAGMGIIGMLGLLNPENPQIFPIVQMVLVAFFVSFILALVLYKEDPINEKAENEATFLNSNNKERIFNPIKGELQALSEIDDEAFSSGALGDGVSIIPHEGRVVAPFDGIVRSLFPTKHAIGLVSKNGCEVLIHIGIDTVKLDGDGFESLVKQGDQVKVGQALINFDLERLKEKGYNLTTPVVITNSKDYTAMKILSNFSELTENGEEILELDCLDETDLQLTTN